ncbi:hypothetical protein QMA73_08305, partial [Burkholderia pseudomallei]|uniref:hypothetical protein n=1 Tax=Burkholderia pseudomallei TaxID=28450 RepID=UPI002DB8666E
MRTLAACLIEIFSPGLSCFRCSRDMGNEGCIPPIVNESSIMDSICNRRPRRAHAGVCADTANAPAGLPEAAQPAARLGAG